MLPVQSKYRKMKEDPVNEQQPRFWIRRVSVPPIHISTRRWQRSSGPLLPLPIGRLCSFSSQQ